MKKLFLSLSRFLLLACLLLGSIGQAWGEEYYTRVTSGTIGAGTYIITNSNHGIMAANAYVKKPTAITANITYDSGNDKFTADEYTNAHAFTVAAGTNNGLTFKYASTHYLYYKGSGTDFTESNTMSKGHEWTVEFDNGYARIKNVNSTGRAIIWNGSAFAPYATSNISSGNSGTNGGVTYSYVYLYKLTSGTSAKTLQSISVNTPSNKTIYTEGETFAPEGLVITADYGTDGTEDVAYSSNADDFTFSPDLTTALTMSHKSVSITWGGKTCTQKITVNPVSVTPSISADDALNLGEDAVADGIFNVTWTAMEDVDVNLYSDEACETEITDSWFQANLDGNNNVTYSATENTGTKRVVYMRLYGIDADMNDYTHVVTITQAASTKHTITINPTSNGRVTTNPATTVKANTAVTLTVTPDPGYELDELTIVDASSNSVAIEDGKFTMPNSDVTISATFKVLTVPYVALELDFSNPNTDWGIPTTRRKTEGTYTFGSYSVTFGASSDGFGVQSDVNVIWGKKDATLTLPKLPFAVKKIEIVGPESGASGTVTQNIYVDDNEASTTQTGANGKKEFVINSTYQVPNTQFVLKITNDNNAQFNTIRFYAASGDANVPTYYKITVADGIVGGVVNPSARKYILAGTEIELTSISKLGYDFVSWNVKDENDNPIEVRNNAFTMPSSNVTVSAVFAAKSNTFVFDLTSSLKDQKASVADNLIKFDATQYVLEFDQNGSSNTKVTNNTPDNNKSATRLYSNHIFRITPKTGYVVKNVQIDLSSNSPGQTRWTTEANQTNCKVVTGNASQGLPGYVKITPKDVTGVVSVKLTGTTEMVGVLVEYAKSDISVNTNGDDTYYATFSSVRDVEFKSCQVFTVNVSGTSLVLNEISDKKVPANTGVLIKATSADAVAFDYLSTPPSAISGTNLLAAGTGVEDNDANYKYYKFAYNNYTAKTGLGFYYANEGGTSITCPIGKAYLKVPTGDGAPTRFVFDEIKPNNPITTDVEAVNKYVDTKKMLVRGQLVIVRGNKMFDMNGRLVK